MYYQDTYASLMKDELIPCLVAQFTGSPSNRGHLKQVHQKVIQIAKKEKSKSSQFFYLADLRKARALLPEDTFWISKVFHSELFKMGIQKGAILLPESLFAQLSVDDIVSETPKNTLHIKIFENADDARKWFKSN